MVLKGADYMSSAFTLQAVVSKVVASGPMTLITIKGDNGFIDILPLQAFTTKKIEEGDVVCLRPDGLWEKDWDATARRKEQLTRFAQYAIEIATKDIERS